MLIRRRRLRRPVPSIGSCLENSIRWAPIGDSGTRSDKRREIAGQPSVARKSKVGRGGMAVNDTDLGGKWFPTPSHSTARTSSVSVGVWWPFCRVRGMDDTLGGDVAEPPAVRLRTFPSGGASVSIRASSKAARANLAKAKVVTRPCEGSGGCAPDAASRPRKGWSGLRRSFRGSFVLQPERQGTSAGSFLDGPGRSTLCRSGFRHFESISPTRYTISGATTAPGGCTPRSTSAALGRHGGDLSLNGVT